MFLFYNTPIQWGLIFCVKLFVIGIVSSRSGHLPDIVVFLIRILLTTFARFVSYILPRNTFCRTTKPLSQKEFGILRPLLLLFTIIIPLASFFSLPVGSSFLHSATHFFFAVVIATMGLLIADSVVRVLDAPLHTLIPAGIIVFVVISIVLNVLSQVLFKDPSLPPLVFNWVPFIGSAVTYGIDPYKFFEDNRKKFGDVYTFVMLGRKITVALGPKGNDFVLNAKLSHVSAEDAYRHVTTPVFGEGVIYDCPNHRLMEQKKFAKTGLTTQAFRSYVPLIAAEVRKYWEKSPHFFGTDRNRVSGKAHLMSAMPEITIFTASRTLQGKEVRAKFDESFADLYHDLDRGFTPIHFVLPNIPIPASWNRDAAQKKISDTYLQVIRERRERGDFEDFDLINTYIKDGVYKDGVRMTDREISNMMIGILMGGQHTSASTSTWALLHLAADPELVERLYQEQLQVYGPEPLRDPTYDDLQKLPLLTYTIRETLRLHPPLHSLMRKVMSSLPIDGTDFVVPKGYYVLAAPGVPMIDSQYFADPFEYRPDRWFDTKNEISLSNDGPESKAANTTVSKGANSPYLPFGAGRHRCIGEQFAYVQLGTILSLFIREFTWTLTPGLSVPKPDYSSMVTLPSEPTDIIWTRRRNPQEKK
ncbi:cytochrome P450 [Lipomyces japonicus]|uniref:cytochrome P450 n=1 Tax=Lipomyces japonicus TaxID=56871 RepID=UPI0034CE52C7